MRLFKVLFMLAIVSVTMVSLSTATMKYSKDTGQKCTYCHTGAPSKTTVNDVGKCFAANDHKLVDKCKDLAPKS
jgi:predicted ATP-grasp superfamily ATP-dependent carboligase